MGSKLDALHQSSYLNGGNATLIETWYEAWLMDPASVPAQWGRLFESMPAGEQAERGHLEIQAKYRDLPLVSGAAAVTPRRGPGP